MWTATLQRRAWRSSHWKTILQGRHFPRCGHLLQLNAAGCTNVRKAGCMRSTEVSWPMAEMGRARFLCCRRPRLCKVHYLRKADLGTPHSMWISLGQDLNGRFSLADKQRLLAQRIHTFHPTCLWSNACFARYLCPLRPDLWIQPVIHEGGGMSNPCTKR